MKKTLRITLALALILAAVMTFTACTLDSILDKMPWNKSDEPAYETETKVYTTDTTLGEGARTVLVTVKAGEKSVTFTVKTDCGTLADALLAVGLAEGEQSTYGLYIKKVNGILADYDVNQRYWNLEQNGKALMTGASGVTDLDGAQYELVYTK